MEKVTNSFCGTPEYFAPEIIIGGGYGASVDWWSFGCFLYELLAGRPPFQDQNRSKLYKAILEGKVTYPEKFSPVAKDLISKLLVTDPDLRLGGKSASEVKGHEFFAGVNWTKVAQRKQAPPFKPTISSDVDVRNFDEEYTTCLLYTSPSPRDS
eukprot:TRINITY_DN10110_c0_g1_i1.p1 TRINITY_DN10110_c0_g1~~TRINITY_DN10110_c0_g1_i1.p1  ORF type:complete len:154 (-),score=36.01 TRINITY_DN10110_c0_g1_i1:26-487(-)